MDFTSFKFIILLVILAVIIYFILMSIKGIDTCKREIEKTHGDIHDFYCEYKGQTVMKCRHIDYDPSAHCYK